MADFIFDTFIQHQTRLERAKVGEGKATRRIVKALDRDIFVILDALPNGYTKKQSNKALSKIEKLINDVYGNVLPAHFSELVSDIVDVELKFAEGAMQIMATSSEEVVSASKAAIINAGAKKTYQGRKLSTWTSRLGEDKLKRLKRALLEGRLEELKKAQILANVRKQFGIVNHHAETITTAHINQYSGLTRDEVYGLNDDIAEVIIWSSILDGSTTQICLDRSQKLYDAISKAPIGHSFPYETGPGRIHFGCRSTGIPSRVGELPKSRVAKPARPKRETEIEGVAFVLRS